MHLEQKDYPAAEARFMELVQAPGTKHDAYAWLGLASLNFATAPSDRKKVRQWCQHGTPLCRVRVVL